jgi:hypothetical protein
MKYLLTLLCAAMIAGCDPLGIACTDEARPGIGLVLVDSATNGPPLSGQLRLLVTDGAFVDSVRATIEPRNYNLPFHLAWERRGTYRIDAFVTGHHPWSLSGVEVQHDGCHVQTRTIWARFRSQ